MRSQALCYNHRPYRLQYNMYSHPVMVMINQHAWISVAKSLISPESCYRTWALCAYWIKTSWCLTKRILSNVIWVYYIANEGKLHVFHVMKSGYSAMEHAVIMSVSCLTSSTGNAPSEIYEILWTADRKNGHHSNTEISDNWLLTCFIQGTALQLLNIYISKAVHHRCTFKHRVYIMKVRPCPLTARDLRRAYKRSRIRTFGAFLCQVLKPYKLIFLIE